ncbi:hypothetical protein JCM11491_000372 [Sporobolomyces phaffii]
MVLQNKHKAQASRQYKKAHGIPLATAAGTSSARETGQERALRLGSNADRYAESDEEAGDGTAEADPEEVDEELLAHQLAEAEELQRVLAAQQSKLTNPTRFEAELDDDAGDVDESFSHLRIASTGKKGKVVHHSNTDEFKNLEGEARRAQAVRDLKDRFSIPSPPPLPTTATASGARTTPGRVPKPKLAAVRRPPPLPGMNKAGEGDAGTKRGGEDFLDSLL